MVILFGEVLELFEYYPAELIGISSGGDVLLYVLKDGLIFIMGLLNVIGLLFSLLLYTPNDLLLLDSLYDIDEILLYLLLE